MRELGVTGAQHDAVHCGSNRNNFEFPLQWYTSHFVHHADAAVLVSGVIGALLIHIPRGATIVFNGIYVSDQGGQVRDASLRQISDFLLRGASLKTHVGKEHLITCRVAQNSNIG